MPLHIDDDVPIPEEDDRALRYPFGLLKVGQSFLVRLLPGEDVARKIRSIRYSADAWASRRQSLRQFKVAQDSKGVRCWRIE